MTRSEWLESIKPGDKVAVIVRWGSLSIDIVTDVKKLHIIVGGRKFKKLNGMLASDGRYTNTSIEEVTVDIIEKIRLNRLQNRFRAINLDDLTIECLGDIISAYDKHNKDKP